MPGYFQTAAEGGAAIALDEVEISILRSLAVQLLELIGPGAADTAEPADPLAELFAEGPTRPPEDPALARLFPDAYEEEADSSEFRRFTENDLRARKRDDALAVVRSLDALTAGGDGGAVLTLDAGQARQWLGALNDLRLTMGARLEISDDENSELYRLPDSDPRKPLVMAYLWLGALQESLVETLMP
ncbi:DUF2017 domain-containing protein [Actinacidiphila sp. bgisy167]|uniref:DUF2017 domain-containing protein n=1 Tax=Actinacidiphila sp. bgisy167 TaxID=3413797 RepID=UPI003D749377